MSNNNKGSIDNTIEGVNTELVSEDKQPIATEVVVDIRVSVENTLPTKIEQFIAKYNFSFDGNSMVMSEELKNEVQESQKYFQEIQTEGKKLTELSKKVKHYLEGIVILNEEIDKEAGKKGFISKNLLKIGNRMKRMKYLGEYVGKVMDVPEIFDRNIMEELGEGGLLDLTHKSEDAINSVETHYKSLITSKESIESSIKTIENDLNTVNEYLSDTTIDDDTRSKLENIKSKLEANLVISTAQLNASNDGIKYYMINVVGLVDELPGAISSLAKNLGAYSLSEAGKKIGETTDNLRELQKETTLAPFKMLQQSTKALAERKGSYESGDEMITEMIGYMKDINVNKSQIEQKSLASKPDSGVLELLAQFNEESARKNDQKLIK